MVAVLFHTWFTRRQISALGVWLLIVGGLMTSGGEAADLKPLFETMTTPDGGQIRHARWQPTEKPRGTVVFLTGRCEYLEKYQEVAEDWLGRGFQVFSLDWRGQGLSSRFLSDRRKCHIPDYAVAVADLIQWLDTVVKPQEVGPTVLVAHSMGGLIALRALIVQPSRFAAVVLTAPMVDINTGSWPRFAAEMATRMASAFGFGTSYAFGQDDYNPDIDARFEGNGITSDPVRFKRIHDGYRNNPDLAIGGVTFGWLTASFRAQALTAVPGVLQEVRLPVLLLIPPDDALVPADSQRLLCQRLHDCTVKEYPHARHDLLVERDDIRSQVWHDIDGFLARVLSPK